MNLSDKGQWAVRYAEAGLRVTIQWGITDGVCDCGNSGGGCSPGKHPVGSLAPRGFNDATTDVETIRRWWSEYPNGNVGIAPGKFDEVQRLDVTGVLVIDIDDDEVLSAFYDAGLASEVVSVTSRGEHHVYFIRGDHDDIKSFDLDIPGVGTVEVKSSSSMITVPPSVHSSGHVYQWKTTSIDEALTLPDATFDLPDELATRMEPRREYRYDGATVVEERRTLVPAGKRHSDMKTKLATWVGEGYVPADVRVKAVLHAAYYEDGEAYGISEEFNSLLRWAEGLVPFEDVIERIDHIERALETIPSVDEALETLSALEPEVVALLRLPIYTDRDAAERFIAINGGDICYVPEKNEWRVWNGNHWQPDLKGAECLRRMISMYPIIEHAAVGIADDTTKAAVKKSARRYGNINPAKNALIAASLDPSVARRMTVWDNEPFLFACPNGVIDLTTGERREGRKDDYLSLATRTNYYPDAKAPRWEQFVPEVFEGDASVVEFSQRWLGYCLTGNTSEHVFLIAQGDGGNGKSRFMETVKYVVGDYGRQLPFTVFSGGAAGNKDAAHGFASLPDVRIAMCNETTRGMRLGEAVVKTITGGDSVVAEKKYEMPFEFVPVCKVMLTTNDLPRVNDNGDGIWRRIRVLRFNAKFTKKTEDPFLQERLEAEAEGVLAWMVRGAVKWIADLEENKRKMVAGDAERIDGLRTPASVMHAAKEYREESDTVKQFHAEMCEFTGPDEGEVYAEVWRVFTTWEDEQGLRPWDKLSKREFKKRLLSLRKVEDAPSLFNGPGNGNRTTTFGMKFKEKETLDNH